MRRELKLWEARYRRAHPDKKVTVIQDITAGHIGASTSRHLKLKAAETKYFFWFLHETIQRVWRQAHQGKVWLAAADRMAGLLQALAAKPWKLTVAQEKGCLPNRVLGNPHSQNTTQTQTHTYTHTHTHTHALTRTHTHTRTLASVCFAYV